jgi:hypothetical protein
VRQSVAISGLVAGVAIVAACPSIAPYVCSNDGDCDRGGARGQCLDDGACAYPDDACDSGWARSPNAAQQPGACVPVEVADTSGTTGTAPSSSSTSTTAMPTSSDSGPQPSCGQQVRLEIDTDFLSTTEVLEGYPLLVIIDDAAIVAAMAGLDPIAVLDDGTVLAMDVERLDAESLVAWLRLPAYALGEPLPIALQFGPDIVAADATTTWTDRYVGVWHMDEAPSGVDGDEIRNSASPTEPAITVGAMTPEQSVAGAFGRGMQFDGLDDALEIDASFVGTLDSYALSMWMRYDDEDGDRGHFFYRLNGDFHYPRCWRFGTVQDGSDSIFCQYQIDGGDPIALSTDATQTTGQLVHLAVMRDAATGRSWVHVDGELVGERMDAPGEVLLSGELPLLLGRGEDDLSLDGMIDEVRVSAEPIPETWIRADFRTQVDPTAAVQVVGGIEPIPADDCAG